jgi:predicted nucleic acid-binding protein
VLAEFTHTGLRRLKLEADFIRQRIEEMCLLYPVFPLTNEIILEALRGLGLYSFSYYDAQIWAVARLYRIPCVLSEDFQDGATFDGVTFRNPL